MDPEIIKFYEDNGYKISNFFDKKRHCGVLLSDAQIKGGIKEYYEEIQSGKIAPKRISMGWGVIQRAKNARYNEFLQDNDIIEKYKPMIAGLHDRIGLIKERLYRWKLCFWIMLGVCVFLGLAYIDVKWGLPLLTLRGDCNYEVFL